MIMTKKLRIMLIAIVSIAAFGAIAFLGYRALAPQPAEVVEGTQEETDLSGIQETAKLITVEALYHNVAMFSYDADEGLTGLWKHGYKKAWCEYDAKVNFSLDTNKVSTTRNGNSVTVRIPRASLYGEPKITSMGDPIVETGLFTDFTPEDEQKMVALAQEELTNKAANDETLINQATENAEKILTQWVQSTGRACGEELRVTCELVN